jgi:hypothetical protein
MAACEIMQAALLVEQQIEAIDAATAAAASGTAAAATSSSAHLTPAAAAAAVAVAAAAAAAAASSSTAATTDGRGTLQTRVLNGTHVAWCGSFGFGSCGDDAEEVRSNERLCC